tara:strand:+ start:1608 stop:2036 length:429 start_codon:yes stop_codon:yes gene_type:complete
MMRLLTILIVLLAGLPRVGLGLIEAPADTGCSDMVCQPVIIEKGCCSEPAPAQDMSVYCPMSDGPCRCGVDRNDDPQRAPEAPLQRSDSQITLGLSRAVAQVCIWSISDDGQTDRPMIGLVEHVHARRTHSETQAILGIWRT